MGLTYNYHEIIYSICALSKIEKHIWLEVGCNTAMLSTRMLSLFDKVIGLDIIKLFSNDRIIFYNERTDDFFKHFSEKPDVIFIDADHSFESVKKDFDNSIKILNKGGIIFLHDTDPDTYTYLNELHCSDCYKIVDWIKNNYKDLDIITLPLDGAGLSIVRRNVDRKVLELLKKDNE